MGRRGFQVGLALELAVALLVLSTLSALTVFGAAPQKGTASMTVCVTASGELMETITWDRMHVDTWVWSMESVDTSSAVANPLAKAQRSGTESKTWAATADWNVQAVAMRGNLSFHDKSVWSLRVPRPVGGWPVCP